MISLILYFALQLQANAITVEQGEIISDIGGAQTMQTNPKDKPQRPTKPPE